MTGPPYFSPGPWSVEADGYSVADETGVILTVQREGRTEIEAKANARASAAAPDLIIALIALLRAPTLPDFCHAAKFAIAILAEIDKADA